MQVEVLTQGFDFDGFWAFAANLTFEFYSLAICQIIIGSFDIRYMDIDVAAAIVRCDKSKSFLFIKPLHCSVHNVNLLKKPMFFIIHRILVHLLQERAPRLLIVQQEQRSSCR